MKTKHTPGPWDVESRMSEYTVHTPNMDICSVYEMDIPVDEAQANARLIAAAPDMLGDLITAVQFIKEMYTGNEDQLPNFVKAAEETIKKATGQ